ncbi:MAG: tetratricopeptide repeat protein, partial [Sphingomonadales bacterium]|nr:tetratricopeptide repeat protein [Sphingomonadales bacterium]
EEGFIKALSLNPNEPQVLNYLGYSWVDRGKNFAQARRFIERAVVQRPTDGAIMDSLGWVLYLMGEYGEAVEKLQRAVELSPNDPLVNDHLGDAYWMVGREIEARFQWRHALDLDPEEGEVQKIQDKIRLGLTIVKALTMVKAMEGGVDDTHDE